MTETAETSTLSTTEGATPQNVVETNETVENTTPQETTTEETATDGKGTDEKVEQPKETVNYEQRYKDLQAEYTKGQQRIAELEKQIPQQQQIVNEQGQINPLFEQRFNHELNNREFSTYQAYAMQIEDTEDRNSAINKLNEANIHYANGNISAYNSCMNEVKQYFNPQLVEQIAEQKAIMKAQKGEYINQAVYQQRMTAGANLEAELKQNTEVWELVNPDSENYSQDVFNVVKQMFDSFGSIDTTALTNVIKAIETNGVRKFRANLEAQKTAEMNKQKSDIPLGEGVAIGSGSPADINTKEYWDKYYSK